MFRPQGSACCFGPFLNRAHSRSTARRWAALRRRCSARHQSPSCVSCSAQAGVSVRAAHRLAVCRARVGHPREPKGHAVRKAGRRLVRDFLVLPDDGLALLVVRRDDAADRRQRVLRGGRHCYQDSRLPWASCGDDSCVDTRARRTTGKLQGRSRRTLSGPAWWGPSGIRWESGRLRRAGGPYFGPRVPPFPFP